MQGGRRREAARCPALWRPRAAYRHCITAAGGDRHQAERRRDRRHHSLGASYRFRDGKGRSGPLGYVNYPGVGQTGPLVYGEGRNAPDYDSTHSCLLAIT